MARPWPVSLAAAPNPASLTSCLMAAGLLTALTPDVQSKRAAMKAVAQAKREARIQKRANADLAHPC